jgi:hypothetical protein
MVAPCCESIVGCADSLEEWFLTSDFLPQVPRGGRRQESLQAEGAWPSAGCVAPTAVVSEPLIMHEYSMIHLFAVPHFCHCSLENKDCVHQATVCSMFLPWLNVNRNWLCTLLRVSDSSIKAAVSNVFDTLCIWLNFDDFPMDILHLTRLFLCCSSLCEDSHGATFFWNYQKVAKNTLNH